MQRAKHLRSPGTPRIQSLRAFLDKFNQENPEGLFSVIPFFFSHSIRHYSILVLSRVISIIFIAACQAPAFHIMAQDMSFRWNHMA